MLSRLDTRDLNFKQALARLLKRDLGSESADQELNQIPGQVAQIIADVRQRGDAALVDLTQKFDDFDLVALGFEFSTSELTAALDSIDSEQRKALDYAAERIQRYHQHQLGQSWQITEPDGTQLGQKVTPLNRVGLYVPGGKAAYPSSVLMNAIPAKVAGVNELIMVTPTPRGVANEMVLAAAQIAGVNRVFRIGGAQAIAALAYGTEAVPQVDKITGPGNAYVAAAKQQVFGQVGIDMIAGPSEVLIIADSTVDPDWVAMDLFAQAEHDEQAQSILLTHDADFAELVLAAIDRLLPSMPRKEIIAASLRNNGAVICAVDDREVINVADVIAAEHLEIFTANADDLAQKISNAGAIFIGNHSAESLGDYCAGPNHVLPTSGTARFSSPLGVYDFQKRTSMIKVSKEGAQEIAKNAEVLAQSESLSAHAESARLRRNT